MRTALDDPYRTAKCKTCGGRLVDPRRPSPTTHKGQKVYSEGQWVHVSLPETTHVPAPRA